MTRVSYRAVLIDLEDGAVLIEESYSSKRLYTLDKHLISGLAEGSPFVLRCDTENKKDPTIAEVGEASDITELKRLYHQFRENQESLHWTGYVNWYSPPGAEYHARCLCTNGLESMDIDLPPAEMLKHRLGLNYVFDLDFRDPECNAGEGLPIKNPRLSDSPEFLGKRGWARKVFSPYEMLEGEAELLRQSLGAERIELFLDPLSPVDLIACDPVVSYSGSIASDFMGRKLKVKLRGRDGSGSFEIPPAFKRFLTRKRMPSAEEFSKAVGDFAHLGQMYKDVYAHIYSLEHLEAVRARLAELKGHPTLRLILEPRESGNIEVDVYGEVGLPMEDVPLLALLNSSKALLKSNGIENADRYVLSESVGQRTLSLLFSRLRFVYGGPSVIRIETGSEPIVIDAGNMVNIGFAYFDQEDFTGEGAVSMSRDFCNVGSSFEVKIINPELEAFLANEGWNVRNGTARLEREFQTANLLGEI